MNVPALAIYTPGGEPLARLELARRLLAETRSLDEVRSIHDLAEAARLYARQARLGLDAQNDAAEIKLRAERRLGELLGTLPKQDGGDAARARSQPATEVPPRLHALGISKSQSSVAWASDRDHECVAAARAWVVRERSENRAAAVDNALTAEPT